MNHFRRVSRRRDVRAFAAGAIVGLAAGVVLAVMLLWRFDAALAWRDAEPVQPSIARDLIEDEGRAATERDDGIAGTTGEPERLSPPPSEAVIGPEPSSPGELVDRRLAMPVDGVQPGDLTPQFFDMRGGSRHHEALDILAPRNTPVVAVEDGTIARLFLSKAGGITIYQFDPTERFCYYYAHLERYADGLQEGDRVRKGQIIGYVGTSGNAPPDTPHLHFAIFRLTEQKRWWEGTPIDPYEVLR